MRLVFISVDNDGYVRMKADEISELVDESYQEGVHDARNNKAVHDGCVGCKHQNQRESQYPCCSCSSCYLSRWEAQE